MNTMIARLITIVALAVLAVPAHGEEYCATRPPPEGLVARCQKLDLIVPASKVELSIILGKWMQTCAKRSRGDSLVFGNESVDYVWSLIKDKRSTPYNGVRILPRYEANQYRSEGRTCYGIASVAFVVAGAEGEVDIDGPIETFPAKALHDYPEDIIKDAAAAGEQALQAHPGTNAMQRARMQNVLKWMRTYGKEFNDTYYAVAPYTTFGDWNDPTCYKEIRVGGTECLGLDAARKACKRELGSRIIELHLNGASAKQMSDGLLELASDIDRGLAHLRAIQGSEADRLGRRARCQSVDDVFMPEIADMARKAKALYNAWDAGPP